MRKNIDIIIGIVILLYILMVNIIGGRIAFSEFFVIVGLLLIGYHYVKKKLKEFSKLYKIFKIVIIGSVSIFILVESCIIFYPKRSTVNTDYIMILGAGIRGTEISTSLKQRLDTTIIYYNKYEEEKFIVVSGGQGKGEDISEALAMKNYLVNNGINADKIIMEDKSTSTYENFKYSKDVLVKHSGRPIEDISIKVITSDFHALRSKILSKRLGYGEVKFYTNLTHPTLIPILYTREFFALGKSIIFDN